MPKYILILIILLLALPASAEIRWTYSNSKPDIQRLQGGILYPYQPEQIEVITEEGTEVQWRYKLLKFVDEGEDIGDYKAFTDKFQKQIDAQISKGVDVQLRSAKSKNWMNSIQDKVSAHVKLGKPDLIDVPMKRKK